MPDENLTIIGLPGSLRKESYSSAVLRTLSEKLKGQADVKIQDIGKLPHYNADNDGSNAPKEVTEMRDLVKASDGLFIVSPEYNYGIPGVLKNTIDWLSRPALKSCLVGKPFLIATASTAVTGGVRAQYQIRESLISALARNVGSQEIVIGGVDKKITDGKLTDEKTIEFAMKVIGELLAEARKKP